MKTRFVVRKSQSLKRGQKRWMIYDKQHDETIGDPERRREDARQIAAELNSKDGR